RGEEIDARTDLFSLGVTLLEVLTGERIFEGSSYTECMKKVLGFKPDALDKFSAVASSEFILFLQKLMHPKKEGRYASAAEALGVIGEKKSPLFLKPNISSPKRKKILLPIGGFVLMLFIIFGWMTLSRQSQPPRIVSDSLYQSSKADTQKISLTENKNVQAAPSTGLPAVRQAGEKVKNTVLNHDSGKVILTSTPWGKVFVNNQLIGETPMAKPMMLAAGKYTIMFTHPLFDPIVKIVNVEANREITVEGNFIQSAGYLFCSAVPWAEVYVDEQYKDTTPLSKPILLSGGKHTVRLKNSSFADIVREISIMPHDTTQLTISFAR
ncbi:MAG: PEGA domain-containing protein, partial [Bacteroidota bacterium]|nr:PEGA domain-containing protein [Bacteroidota bacterium]